MTESGDYISRSAAIEAMYKDAEAHPDHTFWTSQFEALMDIPAADVRPAVRGRWNNFFGEVPGTTNFTVSLPQCSECGFVFNWNSPYCPNCGADMKEAAKEGERA